MKSQSYKDLKVWTRGIELVKEIYKITNSLPKEEVYGLSSQIRRAAVSIPSNIAEGQGRKNIKEFIQFLFVAKGSVAEIETQLIIIEELYKKDIDRAQNLLQEIKKMLYALIQKLKTVN